MLFNLLKSFFLPFLYFFYFLSGIIPRNKNIIVFGCWEGNQIRGNSLILFNYILKKNLQFQIFWLTKNKDLVNSDKFVYLYSLKGFYLMMRAKIFIYSHGPIDLNPWLMFNSIRINLTHIIFPIKYMYNENKTTLMKSLNIFQKFKYILFQHIYMIKSDYIISNSEFISNKFVKIFNTEKQKILPLGTPKVDLFREILNKKCDKISINSELSKISLDLLPNKYILIAPTWREDGSNIFENQDFQITKLDNFLENNQIKLIIKFHSFDKTGANIFDHTKNIIKIDDSVKNFYEIMANASLLITDYSSIWSDYLFFNKPIIFANIGEAKFKNKRGVDNQIDLPGIKKDNWDEILESVQEIILLKKDLFKSKRDILRKKIYSQDNKTSCENIVNLINKL